MNAGQRFGALVEGYLEASQEKMGRTLGEMTDNQIISTLLTAVGMFIAMVEEVEMTGGPKLAEVVLGLRSAPDPPFEPDWSALRQLYSQEVTRGASAGQDGAGGGREG